MPLLFTDYIYGGKTKEEDTDGACNTMASIRNSENCGRET
jgi:hypothetical protein